MKSRHSASTQSSCTWLSSSTPWTVSSASTTPYPSRGVHTATCISYQPPRAASALTHSMHGPNQGWPLHRSQQALDTESGEYDLL